MEEMKRLDDMRNIIDSEKKLDGQNAGVKLEGIKQTLAKA